LEKIFVIPRRRRSSKVASRTVVCVLLLEGTGAGVVWLPLTKAGSLSDERRLLALGAGGSELPARDRCCCPSRRDPDGVALSDSDQRLLDEEAQRRPRLSTSLTLEPFASLRPGAGV
jgi:hypothetical protein